MLISNIQGGSNDKNDDNMKNIQGGVGRSEAKYESQMRRIAQIFRIMRILRSIEWICFNQTRLCIIEMGTMW